MSYNPAPKQRNPWKIGCLALVVVAVLFLGGCGVLVAVIGAGDDTSNNDSGGGDTATTQEATETGAPGTDADTIETEQAPAGDSSPVITLEASTTGSTASVGWGELGSLSTADITGDWTQEIPDTDEIYSLTVQDMSMDNSAEVTCRVIIDGEVVDESSATGAAAIATCTTPLF